ncbi:hypothetical protein CFC21_044099 [Triticum aestivum]|uniref:F-box domain-containing protein n=2 Tax=Triticum aestivum TaxID=4565 RepID=A0A9R1FR51_WHEAT|nr:hypothetical protein CFC21_044099 [Triticum aestivum]CDM86253.1 unnamed protein product [Triticum aestivum]
MLVSHLFVETYIEDGDDLISKLPDEVLFNVVGRLDDIDDAARTGVLSTWWRWIPAMLPNIVMSVDSFKPKHRRRWELGHEYLDRAKADMIEAARATTAMIGATRDSAIMVGAARSMLGMNNTRSLYAIDVLHLEIYLGYHSVSIGPAIADAMATDKIGLAKRQLRSFVGACWSAFGGLVHLKLRNLRLPDDGLPKILSTCKWLQFLMMYNCDAGHLFVLEVEHPRLGELEIVDCDYDRVELKWLPELTLFTVSRWISPHDLVSFGHVPLLRSVSMANTCLTEHKVPQSCKSIWEA